METELERISEEGKRQKRTHHVPNSQRPHSGAYARLRLVPASSQNPQLPNDLMKSCNLQARISPISTWRSCRIIGAFRISCSKTANIHEVSPSTTWYHEARVEFSDSGVRIKFRQHIMECSSWQSHAIGQSATSVSATLAQICSSSIPRALICAVE